MAAPQTFFITGASSGFGREITRLLVASGRRVAATSRSTDKLAALADSVGDGLWTRPLDVSDAADIRRAADEAVRHFGGVDVVVSCAGFGVLGAAEELTDDLVQQQIAVNLVGSINLVRAFTPLFRAQGHGHFIQMSSSGGQVADPGMSVYNASKFGIEGFYESAATELAPFGIRMTLVEPGGSRTDFNAHLVAADPLPPYDAGILGQIRGMLGGGVDPAQLRKIIAGDPAKIAQAVADVAGDDDAPLRITLGAAAYQSVTGALSARLAALEAQKELALSTDADDAR
jgi:NAD(P)-dependent dehydrogenase (short-subunit alcohol dehydrogenase family)